MKTGNHSTNNFFIPLLIVLSMMADGAALPLASQSTDYLALVKRGEALMAAGAYNGAGKVFLNVLPRIGDRALRVRVRFNLARIAFHLDDVVEAEEYLRAMFEIDRVQRIDGTGCPEEFVLLIDKVKAEYWFSIRADDDYRDVAEKQVIANLSRKPKKKKIPTLLIVAAGVVVAAAVVALLILPGGEQETPEEATLIIENRTDWILTVWVGTSFEYRVQPWQDWSHTFPAGIYNITISNGENTRILYSRVLPVSESLIITVDPAFFD